MASALMEERSDLALVQSKVRSKVEGILRRELERYSSKLTVRQRRVLEAVMGSMVSRILELSERGLGGGRAEFISLVFFQELFGV